MRQRRFARRVAGSDPSSPLAIYRRNHALARRRALRTLFPTCLRVVGDACFDALAAHYHAEFPCRCVSLEYDGQGFAESIAEILRDHPEAFSGLEYLPDLARLELHRQHARLAMSPGLTFDWAAHADLCAEELSCMRPMLDPSLRLLRTDWALLELLEPAQDVARTGALWTRYRGGFEHGACSLEVAGVIERIEQGATMGALEGTPLELLAELVSRGFVLGLES